MRQEDLEIPVLEFELFRRMIREEFGIDYSLVKRELLRVRLLRRVHELGLRRFSEYYRLLRYAPPDHAEWGALADCVTNNETYFFRESQHLTQLAEIAPALAGQSSRLRALSAGCSSGEEAFGMAMVLASAGAVRGNFEVIGVDVSGRKIAEAQRGRYFTKSFRDGEPPPEAVDFPRFADREDDLWVIRPGLRTNVRFERANLLHAASVKRLGTFDVIFCRNVLIYAHEESFARFLESLRLLLRRGGYLFLGVSETLVGRPHPFKPTRIGGGFAYVCPS
jgi:chemotaxis protein methyltransferase CheR